MKYSRVTHLTFEIFLESDIPLVLTDQPSLVLDYSDRYLVAMDFYRATLDIVNNSLVVSGRKEFSPTQKWIISSTGMFSV